MSFKKDGEVKVFVTPDGSLKKEATEKTRRVVVDDLKEDVKEEKEDGENVS